MSSVQSTVSVINPLNGNVWAPLTNAERATIKRQIAMHGLAIIATFSDRQIALINAGGLEK